MINSRIGWFSAFFAALYFGNGARHGLKVKGKVLQYSLPSVGPEDDPGVQAISPHVTF